MENYKIVIEFNAEVGVYSASAPGIHNGIVEGKTMDEKEIE